MANSPAINFDYWLDIHSKELRVRLGRADFDRRKEAILSAYRKGNTDVAWRLYRALFDLDSYVQKRPGTPVYQQPSQADYMPSEESGGSGLVSFLGSLLFLFGVSGLGSKVSSVREPQNRRNPAADAELMNPEYERTTERLRAGLEERRHRREEIAANSRDLNRWGTIAVYDTNTGQQVINSSGSGVCAEVRGEVATVWYNKRGESSSTHTRTFSLRNYDIEGTILHPIR
ncbi:MAG: hypothetical protein HYW26_03255 [Candidatus Aenigmarchaeota archaeon]|nr:hypothetical protein [Candidatus Aenigmarchaeota archaeon]